MFRTLYPPFTGLSGCVDKSTGELYEITITITNGAIRDVFKSDCDCHGVIKVGHKRSIDVRMPSCCLDIGMIYNPF